MPEGMTRRLGGRFALEREIGEGGMARVYLGRDEVLDRPIAIKVLRPHYGETGMRARFEREGRTAARLSHPNIVEVYDAGEGELDGREVSYIVMEYVPGGDLKQLMEEKGPIPGKELARLGAEVSSGLARAHDAGVVHRDIKPANILIDGHGRPKLSDFGIARALGATQATQTGTYLGTALYSSPEQLKGEKVTPKSDVYSLGITLYQAATGGEPPFSGTPLEVASQHVSRTPTAPSVLGADLSGRFEKLILDCVEKDPDLRPTAEEIHERLRKEAGSTHNARAYAAPPMSEPPPAASTRAPPREQSPQRPPSGGEPGGVLDDGPPGGSGGGRREERRRRGPILLGAAALFLILVGAALVFALTGGYEATETAQEGSQQDNEQASSSEDTEGQSDLLVSSEETTPEQAAPEETSAAEDSGGDLSAAAAAQTVEDYYTVAADGDYDQAWNSLSTGYQQQLGSQTAYTSQFDTLNSVEFVEGPTPEVSGETATVTGGTVATHTNRVDRTAGTWTLVNENEEWKIDGQNISVIGTS
ncbi:MAG TPA: serine/threonine-protein kinase [Rubrobacter sp.]|nr:serine/threonine-protein kinase [Rubrobacter sp.]